MKMFGNKDKQISHWRGMPRTSIAIFLLAVFFTFTAMALANDILGMGRAPVLRLGVSILFSGVFAVYYATCGILLRGRWWIAFIPVFAIQFILGGLMMRWLPDGPRIAQTPEVLRLESRLNFDASATIIVVCLGYAGFVYVSVSEGKRYGKTRAEMALLETELAAARQVQEVILPNPGEKFPGYKVESVYRPAQQVGGDFFQILPTANDGLLIVFGDVAGKGLPAAMLVSMLVGSIRSTAESTSEPDVLLRQLHERLLGRASGGFSTALAAHIAHDGAVTIANAGQLSPYLDGREVELAGALPLGVTNGGIYDSTRLQMPAGSRLTFVSDGVVEAQNKGGELFGFDRARDISTQSATAIADAAVQFGQSDDITVLTIQRSAA